MSAISVQDSSPRRRIMHRPVERVRVGHRQRRLGAVDLDVAVARRLHVEARDERRDRLRRPNSIDASRRGSGPRRRSARRGAAPSGSGAARGVTRRRRGDAARRSEQLDERGEVVGTHVEQRSGAVLVEDRGIRVPALGPRPSMNAFAASGSPMSPRSITARALWSPAPRNVSGAQPSRVSCSRARARRVACPRRTRRRAASR